MINWELFQIWSFPECFRGPLKTMWWATCDPRATICPPLFWKTITSSTRRYKTLKQCSSCNCIHSSSSRNPPVWRKMRTISCHIPKQMAEIVGWGCWQKHVNCLIMFPKVFARHFLEKKHKALGTEQDLGRGLDLDWLNWKICVIFAIEKLIFWTLFWLGFQNYHSFWTMVGLGLNFEISRLDLDRKIWQSAHLCRPSQVTTNACRALEFSHWLSDKHICLGISLPMPSPHY